jgi:O-antigen/teichoic acid export membrane protein
VPFALALFLFACLNVWEPYGTGDARPWATYMFTRSAAPALVAVGYLAAGARFPAPLAGTVECAVLLMLLVVLSRLNPPDLRLAMRSHRGPWGSVVAAGAPSVIAQASVASGTLILSGARSPAAAGVFAACVRLMSGLNALNGIVATALYPRLASGGRDRTQDEPVVTAALRLIALVAVTATAVCVLLGEPIAGAFLGDDGRTSVDALILTAATVAALGNAVMFIYQLTAGGHERDMLAPCAAGAAITIILGLGATAAVDPRVDLVATALLIGMLVNMTALGLRLRRRLPYVARSVTAGMAVAVATAALAALSLISQARIPVGIVLLVVAAVIARQLAPAVRLMRTGI